MHHSDSKFGIRPNPPKKDKIKNFSFQSIFLNILTGSKQLGEGTIPKARLVNHLKNDAAAAFLNSAPILKSIC